MKARSTRWCFALILVAGLFFTMSGEAAQKELQKLTVGYTPISGATLPFFIAVEEKLFQKYGFEIAPVFMGGSPLINSAILAGEFPIGYTGGGAIISSRLAGSDLIADRLPAPGAHYRRLGAAGDQIGWRFARQKDRGNPLRRVNSFRRPVDVGFRGHQT
jgi:hypothetical protein